MSTAAKTKTKRPTAADLRASVEATGSVFFTAESMRFFGDTMRNFRVSGPIEIQSYSDTYTVWVLERRNPVKHGLWKDSYFDVTTFARRFKDPTPDASIERDHTSACPECGFEGPHDDNGAATKTHRSFVCASCGLSFDALTEQP
jgi:hypothetical protein